MYYIDREKLLEFLNKKSKAYENKARRYAKELKFSQASQCIAKRDVYNELFSIICENKEELVEYVKEK